MAELTPYEREYFEWLTTTNRRSLPAPRLLKDMHRAASLENEGQRWAAMQAVFDKAQDIARRGHADIF